MSTVAAFLLSLSLAHNLGQSFSDVKVVPQGVSVIFALDADDFEETLRRKFDDDGSGNVSPDEMRVHQDQLVKLMTAGYVVRVGGGQCHPEIIDTSVKIDAKLLQLHLLYTCEATGPLSIELLLLERLKLGHSHLATLRMTTGIVGTVLQAGQSTWTEDNANLTQTLWRFFRLGVEHILGGFDHLLFLFGLLLVTTRLWDLVRIVSSFTIAHSITLIVAALGVVALSPKLVEPAIALSIAYVGFENLWRKVPRNRAWLTFGLGLIHGFGFASVLAETGLPQKGRVLALVTFNLGVETGQLGVVSAVIPILFLIRRRGYTHHLTKIGSASVLALGLFWFLIRVWTSLG